MTMAIVWASCSVSNAGKEPICCRDGTAEAFSSGVLREIALRVGLVLVTGNMERRIEQKRV